MEKLMAKAQPVDAEMAERTEKLAQDRGRVTG